MECNERGQMEYGPFLAEFKAREKEWDGAESPDAQRAHATRSPWDFWAEWNIGSLRSDTVHRF